MPDSNRTFAALGAKLTQLSWILVTLWQGSAHAMERLVCESVAGKYQHCPAPTQYPVQIVRQLSKKNCVQGSTWGIDRRGVWVDGGCRAEFVIGGAPGVSPGYGRTPGYVVVECASFGAQANYCRIPASGGVRLVADLSFGRCVPGQTWNYDAGGIWVGGGCRGQFAVAAAAPGYGPTPRRGGGASVICESVGGRYQHCPVPTGGYAQIRQQLSKTPCQPGVSWGYDYQGVWVDRGCRAVFAVGGGG